MFRFFRRPLIVWREYVYQRFTEFLMSNRVLNVIPAQAESPSLGFSGVAKVCRRTTLWIPAYAGMTAGIYKLRGLIAIFAASGRKSALSGGVEASFRFAFDGMRFAGGAGFSGTSPTLWPPP